MNPNAIMHTTTKKKLSARARVPARVRVCFWDKELCKHEFTGGGHYCPGPGASYPSGTSLAQSFLLVTLPVTSTSMRYDRYDTCLHVRTYTHVPAQLARAQMFRE